MRCGAAPVEASGALRKERSSLYPGAWARGFQVKARAPPTHASGPAKVTAQPTVSQADESGTKQLPLASADILKPGYVTTPAAILELMAAAIVVNHAATAEDMAAVVWASAFAAGLFFLWVFHNAAILRKRILQTLLIFFKVMFAMLLIVLLWDLSFPHKIWTGAGFRISESSQGLTIAAVLLGVSQCLLVLFRMLRIGRSAWMDLRERLK